METKLEKILIGKALKTEDLKHEKFNVFWGLPILSSDAISSVAYAGEEILWVLIPVIGIMSYKYMLYAALSIVFLLFLLVFSYRQTIDCYPHGGGSYIVAKDNLGDIFGLIAASSLSIDYILTVAVSSTAGTAAITSAIPELFKFKVPITVGIILFMTIGNLRGLKDSSKIFGIPTYLFVISILSMIVTGIVKVYVFGYTPQPIYKIPNAVGDITILLFLKAFASGCTALTGIEAVSDGIPNFKEPSQKNAKIVLGLLATLVLMVFGGLSFLATLYHAVPKTDATVISQIAMQVYGNSAMYYIVQFTTAIILILAANTAFADLPLLLSIIARDGFAPRQFTKRGKRLSFSNGIILLGLFASLLVIFFKGDTHLLMPLYAVGVFISFTLSQTGMFTRWIRRKEKGWKHKAFINGMGAIVTFCTVILIGYTKFFHGAWIVCLLIPIMVVIMLRIKRHYNIVADQLRLPLDEKPKAVDHKVQKHYVIVPIDTLNKAFLKSLNYARSISDNIIVFHVSVDDECTEKLVKKWNDYNVEIPMVIKKSPYRSILGPLIKFIESEEYEANSDDIITVVMPQFVVTKWWHYILHNQTSIFIKSMLLKRRNIAMVTIPYLFNE